MDTTPALSRFDDFYKTEHPAVGDRRTAARDRRAGTGRADPGQGARRRLRNRRAHDPAHPARLRRARHRLRAAGGRAGPPECRGQGRRRPVRGRRRDEPGRRSPRYDTDRRQRAVPHLRRHRPAEIRRQPARRVPAGRLVHVLALSDAGRGFGPEVSDEVIREAFADGWVLEALEPTTYRGVVTEVHAEALGLPVGTRVDEPAWLATGSTAVVTRRVTELTSARHIRGGRSQAGGARVCAGTAAPRLPCRRDRRPGWRPPAAFRRRSPARPARR